MTGRGVSGSAWLAGAGVLLAGSLLAASALLVPEPPQRMAAPAAEELAGLAPYLDPAEAEVPGTRGVPESVVIRGDPFTAAVVAGGWSQGGGRVGVGAGGPAPAPRWRLSAVLIAGGRRTAIVNDRMVRPGERLDGARVQSIESDHVVIIMPDGQRRRLDLERQEP